jgi:arylsulfatase A-like enzyme
MIVLDDLDSWTFERLLFNNGPRYETGCSEQYLKYICTKLYQRGTYFRNAYVTNSLCCPSRTTILTGQYPHNTGLWQNAGNNDLDWFKSGYSAFKTNPSVYGYTPEQMTINRLLKDSGYFTAMIGKLLNGTTRGSITPPFPTSAPLGWNMFYSLLDPNSHKMYDYEYQKWLDTDSTDTINHDQYGVEGGLETTPGGTVRHSVFQSDTLADHALDAMWVATHHPYFFAPKNFFITLAPTVPHLEASNDPANNNKPQPLSFAGQTQMRTRGRLSPGMLKGWFPVRATVGQGIRDLPPESTATISESLSGRTFWVRQGVGWEYSASGYSRAVRPNLTPQLENLRQLQQSRVEAMMALDESLGYVFTWMENNNYWSNTAVILVSDNGYHLGEHSLTEKSTPFEEAIHVPLIIRAPNDSTQATNNSLVLTNDLAPTIAAYAGATGQAYWRPDGRSLRSLIGTTTLFPRKQFLIAHRMAPWDYPPWYDGGVRRLNVFGIPHYNALRQLGDGRNGLYVRYSYDTTQYPSYYDKGQWSPAGQDPNPVLRQNCESFNMNVDPYQSILSNPDRSCRQDYIDAFQSFLTCREAACATLEDRIYP